MKRILCLLFILAIICACNSTQKKDNKNNEAIIANDTSNNLGVTWDKADSLRFSNIFTKRTAFKSVLKEYIDGGLFNDTSFQIILNVDAQKIINDILVNQDSYKEIVSKYKMFRCDSIIDETEVIYRLTFHDSYIAFSHSDSPLIIIASIKDKEVSLKYNLKIGMTKNEFYKSFFNCNSINEFKEIETFEVHDLLGEYEARYIFKKDTLFEVSTEIVDHWAIDKYKLKK